MLLLLPTEVILGVFAHLDYRDLLTCSLVCRLFHIAIRDNAFCQYTIELAVAGMKNGPPSTMSHADRLNVLRNSQAAWHSLEWTASRDIRMLPGSLYELYGGVLVQSNHAVGSGLVFRRLPSHYRGIEERVWSIDLDIFIRDFTLDPAQDLLVLIAWPVLVSGAREAWIETLIHLRSLTTGKVHPLATRSPILRHDVDRHMGNLSFLIQTHGDRVAVHFIGHGPLSELVVWNWKTGDMLLNTYSTELMTFSFFTERLLLIGGFRDIEPDLTQPRLAVVDLDSSTDKRIELEEMEYLCTFLYPPCYPWVHASNMLIRSDPCTGWSPHPSVQVPFSIGKGPRLFIVTIWAMHGEEISPIDLFVLSDTLLEHINTIEEGDRGRDFEWAEWGPNGTRMIAQAPNHRLWVCYVFGMRFSMISGDWRANGDRESRTVEVWDFNQVGIRRDLRREEGDVELHVGDTSVLSGRVFLGEVRTRLPYRVFRRKLAAPTEEDADYREAMCSEDTIILVDSQERLFRVLTF